MPERLRVLRTVPAFRRSIMAWRAGHANVALVPTMGALHAGHLALVRAAKRRAQRTIVSIFVNPAQFAPEEDLARYTRTFDADVAVLRELGVDLVWAPPVEVMYPPGFSTKVVPSGPTLLRARKRVAAAFLFRCRNRRRQIADSMRARLRDVRGKGLSAAQGGEPDGGRSQSADEDHCCSHRAGEGRARAVFPQRVPLRRGARGRFDPLPCTQGLRGKDRKRRAHCPRH